MAWWHIIEIERHGDHGVEPNQPNEIADSFVVEDLHAAIVKIVVNVTNRMQCHDQFPCQVLHRVLELRPQTLGDRINLTLMDSSLQGMTRVRVPFVLRVPELSVYENQNLLLSLRDRGELRQVKPERLGDVEKVHVVKPGAKIDHHAPSRTLLNVANHLLLPVRSQVRWNLKVALKNVLACHVFGP